MQRNEMKITSASTSSRKANISSCLPHHIHTNYQQHRDGIKEQNEVRGEEIRTSAYRALFKLKLFFASGWPSNFFFSFPRAKISFTNSMSWYRIVFMSSEKGNFFGGGLASAAAAAVAAGEGKGWVGSGFWKEAMICWGWRGSVGTGKEGGGGFSGEMAGETEGLGKVEGGGAEGSPFGWKS
jgi:hypothetical protein